MLEVAAAECDEMCGDLYGDADNPDMDTIYSAAEEMRRFADNLNNIADTLMVEYRKMDHHQHLIDLDDLRSESYAH
jgi:kynureninase